MKTIETIAAMLQIKDVVNADGSSVANVTDSVENFGEYFLLLEDGGKRRVTIDGDGIKIEYELADIKRRFEGEDICFGSHTPMGEISEVIDFDNETMRATVKIEYPDGDERVGTIEIDMDLGGFDTK